MPRKEPRPAIRRDAKEALDSARGEETAETAEEAIELLQQLGLKEYEARCFVGLTRLDIATAKRLSGTTEVPRTRVYDAIRALEAQGLVEIQHSSPQQFRAVPLEEATETFRDRYEDRVERLHQILDRIEIVGETDHQPVQQVWTITGHDAIENRTEKLLTEATDEIVLVICAESLLTDDLIATLREISDSVDLLVGASTEALREQIHTSVPATTTFLSGLEWLHGQNSHADEIAIGRLVLIDQSAILVSSIKLDTKTEHAIFGEGLGNGMVVVAHRLMSQGLVTCRDPAQQSP